MKHPKTGFENLHRHTDFSLLDGYGTVEEYAAYSSEVDQKYLCISDHGMMGAIPRQISACDKYNLHPIFACELYVNPHQTEKAEWGHFKKQFSEMTKDDVKKFRKSYHLLAIAYTTQGYSNLVRLTSWAWTQGFYYKPRVNHEMLMQYKEGIIFTSCCYMSEIGQAFDTGNEELAEEKVRLYHEMFGENFRLEIMLLDFKKQKPYDAFIIKMRDKYGIPLIITTDCHYCKQEDSHFQQLMLMASQRSTIKEVEAMVRAGQAEDLFELQDQNLWMKSEDELNQKWESDYTGIVPYELFMEAKANTVKICEMTRGVVLDRSIKLPQLPDANAKFREAIMYGFKQRRLPYSAEYLGRVKEEFGLICRKGFASYFLIQKQMTDEARRVCPEILGWGSGHEAVGPGRGSAVGALVCYCLGITDVDPIKHDLLFSRFLSEARGGKSMKTRFRNVDPILNEAA